MSKQREKCYVVMSFKMKDGNWKEDGKRYIFFTHCSARSYLIHAGKLVPGEDNVYYDDPFEHRWNYAIIEEVYEGFCFPKVMSWWKAEYDGNRVSAVELEKAPFNASQQFGFTGCGC